MHLAARLQSPWLAPLLAGLAAALLAPAGAAAKVTCDSRGVRAPSLDLRGLPERPVAGRTYTLRLATRAHAVNPAPALMTMYCGRGHPTAVTRPANGWFREVAPGVFAVRLRFVRPGPWAVSVMDLDGSFDVLGRRNVRSAATLPAPRPDSRASRANGSGWTWPVAALLGAGTGLAVAVRRRRRS